MRLRGAALFLFLACSSDGVPLPWSGQHTLPPGTFWEVNLVMTGGQAASAHFSAPAALDWNVHGHPADAAIAQYTAGQGASGDIPFTPPADGRYSFYWENRGSTPVALEVMVTGHGTVVSTSVGP